MLELSLCIAFALVVFATTLHLIQESTERVNKGFAYQKYQQTAFRTILKLNLLNDFHPNTNSIQSMTQQLSIVPETTTIIRKYFNYENTQWIESLSSGHLIKTTISDSRFTKNLYNYTSSFKSKLKLKQCLTTLKLALNQYYINNGTYPPSNHLNYLIQPSILEKLPGNPYTTDNNITYSLKNMTDWYYRNANNTITLYAYSHPNLQLNWNY